MHSLERDEASHPEHPAKNEKGDSVFTPLDCRLDVTTRPEP